jgi:hypothetical protein
MSMSAGHPVAIHCVNVRTIVNWIGLLAADILIGQ